MKKILLLLLVFPLFISSCGSDDDEFLKENVVAGTWYSPLLNKKGDFYVLELTSDYKLKLSLFSNEVDGLTVQHECNYKLKEGIIIMDKTGGPVIVADSHIKYRLENGTLVLWTINIDEKIYTKTIQNE